MNPEELKQIAVLQAMDSEALARLAAVLEEKDCTDGQTIFAEGDPGDSMYFIAKGCVRIEKRAQATGAIQKTLTVLEAGDYFELAWQANDTAWLSLRNPLLATSPAFLQSF